MLGINVTQSDENLVIKWQLSKFEIPLSEIVEVTQDDTYGGSEKNAIRIGTPYGTTDRVVIKTQSIIYILFTSDAAAIIKKIEDLGNSES
ncbi:hypothetical protein H70357_34050 [Paenibacillus sp. FSL H7-0357]|uniref:SunI/YnzG family protein n=1 Tax=Paenibacillus sp. FSL H7-0357 TaxID=1536774 RepID=UPI0004F65D18|nr:PH domain-containing protein [Paenibacillus sp. FSL H7-0357]AIQ21148.1 hypothetical protein H70357_34050 [Paenibacillus sp. FSL H7-0357]